MAAGGGEDVGWTYCLDGDGAVYILGRKEALQALKQDTYAFGFDLICWFGFGVGRSERVLLQGAGSMIPPPTRVMQG
jgi:hypothetical protein